MELIERPIYLNRLKAMRLTPDIKIITGIRRSGKSKLLLLFMQYLREVDSFANISSVTRHRSLSAAGRRKPA